jgi:hypothetical protein
MGWQATWDEVFGSDPDQVFNHFNHISQGAQDLKKSPNNKSRHPESHFGLHDSQKTKAHGSRVNMVNMANIPPLVPDECREVSNWPPQTQRVFTRLLDHFESRDFPLIQAERLAFTTLMVLKKRKGWPLILVHDLPPEVGRAIGYVLDEFPGAKLMNSGHKMGTEQ